MRSGILSLIDSPPRKQSHRPSNLDSYKAMKNSEIQDSKSFTRKLGNFRPASGLSSVGQDSFEQKKDAGVNLSQYATGATNQEIEFAKAESNNPCNLKSKRQRALNANSSFLTSYNGSYMSRQRFFESTFNNKRPRNAFGYTNNSNFSFSRKENFSQVANQSQQGVSGLSYNRFGMTGNSTGGLSKKSGYSLSGVPSLYTGAFRKRRSRPVRKLKEFPELARAGFDATVFDEEKKVNNSMLKISQNLLEMARSLKESVKHLKKYGKNYGAFSKMPTYGAYDRAKMNVETEKTNLREIHGVNVF